MSRRQRPKWRINRTGNPRLPLQAAPDDEVADRGTCPHIKSPVQYHKRNPGISMPLSHHVGTKVNLAGAVVTMASTSCICRQGLIPETGPSDSHLACLAN